MDGIVSSRSHAKKIAAAVILLMMLCGLIAFGLWAYFSRLDIITSAPGVIIPSRRIQSIQSLDGGILDQVMVKEGDVVEKGQLIVRMNKVKSQSVYGESLAKIAALEGVVARTRTEIMGGTLKFPPALNEFPELRAAQRAMYEQKRLALNEDIAVLEHSYKLAKEELDINEPMLSTGEVSQVDVIRLRRQVNEIRGTINQRKFKYLNEAQAEMAKAQDELASQREIMAARKDQVEHADIFAMMKGVVKNVRITTQGGVVRPAEEILQIVPIDDELLADVKIKPSDVAFLKPGLPVTVKVDAYDYAIYGTLEGELTYLSPDTLKEETPKEELKYYRGTVRTYGSKLKNPKAEKIEIIPGMTVVAEIKTGDRTVMEYILKPITRGLQNSLRER